MSEEEPQKSKLTHKQQIFINEYLLSFNATQSALKAGYSEKTAYAMGWENLRKPEIAEVIQARIDETRAGADEALKVNSEILHGDLGTFFKPVDEWMFNPLPEYEILDEREVMDETVDPPKKRVSYRVRHVVLDMDKVLDPRYSWLIKKFSNSRKSGLSIEVYDKAAAIDRTLKVSGKYIERHELTGKDGESLIKPEAMKPSEIAERVAALLRQKDVTNGS